MSAVWRRQKAKQDPEASFSRVHLRGSSLRRVSPVRLFTERWNVQASSLSPPPLVGFTLLPAQRLLWQEGSQSQTNTANLPTRPSGDDDSVQLSQTLHIKERNLLPSTYHRGDRGRQGNRLPADGVHWSELELTQESLESLNTVQYGCGGARRSYSLRGWRRCSVQPVFPPPSWHRGWDNCCVTFVTGMLVQDEVSSDTIWTLLGKGKMPVTHPASLQLGSKSCFSLSHTNCKQARVRMNERPVTEMIYLIYGSRAASCPCSRWSAGRPKFEGRV